MGVTLKMVNKELAGLGTKTELAKGAGYFLFRGGEADDWIDRTVAVPTIGSLTLEQWLNEYKRLKTLNDDMVKTAKQSSPRPAKTQKPRHEASTGGAPAQTLPPRETPPHDSNRKVACSLKTKLVAELDEAKRVWHASKNRKCARRERVEFRISSLCPQTQLENAPNSTAPCLLFGITP
jgi:hypothetical protein